MKIYLFFLVVLFWSNIGSACYGQTIVSTEVENKRAVLEYFRGIYCVYCPEADQFATQLQNDYDDRFIPININAGDYAYPFDPYALDLRSDFGQGLLDLTNLIGYPAGMVNRKNFSGLEQGAAGTFAINRERWGQAVEELIEETSPVNIGLQATYDINSREMEIKVELYYTQSVTTATQSLHIAVLQDNIRTLQAGSEEKFNYFHSNVLRDMVTGQWGMPLGSKEEGAFVTETFNYSLPQELFDTGLDPSEIKLVAFVTEDRENILTGIRHHPAYITSWEKDLHVLSVYPSDDLSCEERIKPTVVLRNDGHDLVENARVSYQVNGGELQYFDWPGQLKTFEKAWLSLPDIEFDPAFNFYNQIEVRLVNTGPYDDDNPNNNQMVSTFKSAAIVETPNLKLEIGTDNFGYETYWEIVDEANEIVAQGGNLLVGLSGGGKQVGSSNNPGVYSNYQMVKVDVNLPQTGCYILRIYDDYGDGFCCSFGDGFYRLRDEQGQVLVSGNRFGVLREESFEFKAIATATSGVAPSALAFQVFPNPVYEGELKFSFELEEAGPVVAQLKTAAGQLVKELSWPHLAAQHHNKQFHLSDLPSGVYFLMLSVGNRFSTQKVLVL